MISAEDLGKLNQGEEKSLEVLKKDFDLQDLSINEFTTAFAENNQTKQKIVSWICATPSVADFRKSLALKIASKGLTFSDTVRENINGIKLPMKIGRKIVEKYDEKSFFRRADFHASLSPNGRESLNVFAGEMSDLGIDAIIKDLAEKKDPAYTRLVSWALKGGKSFNSRKGLLKRMAEFARDKKVVDVDVDIFAQAIKNIAAVKVNKNTASVSDVPQDTSRFADMAPRLVASSENSTNVLGKRKHPEMEEQEVFDEIIEHLETVNSQAPEDEREAAKIQIRALVTGPRTYRPFMQIMGVDEMKDHIMQIGEIVGAEQSAIKALKTDAKRPIAATLGISYRSTISEGDVQLVQENPAGRQAQSRGFPLTDKPSRLAGAPMQTLLPSDSQETSGGPGYDGLPLTTGVRSHAAAAEPPLVGSYGAQQSLSGERGTAEYTYRSDFSQIIGAYIAKRAFDDFSLFSEIIEDLGGNVDKKQIASMLEQSNGKETFSILTEEKMKGLYKHINANPEHSRTQSIIQTLNDDRYSELKKYLQNGLSENTISREAESLSSARPPRDDYGHEEDQVMTIPTSAKEGPSRRKNSPPHKR